MTDKKLAPRFIVLIGMVVIAATIRIMPHWPNFAPFGAMALFGAAHFKKPIIGLLVTLGALFIGDIILNNTVYAAFDPQFQWAVYLAFISIFILGFYLLKKVTVSNVILGAVAASVLFFLISNFGTWQMGIMGYPKNFAGLMMAYGAGLEPYLYTLASDLFYSILLFGSFALMKQRFPSLAIAK